MFLAIKKKPQVKLPNIRRKGREIFNKPSADKSVYCQSFISLLYCKAFPDFSETLPGQPAQ